MVFVHIVVASGSKSKLFMKSQRDSGLMTIGAAKCMTSLNLNNKSVIDMTLVNRLKSTGKMGRRISCNVGTSTHTQTHTHTYMHTHYLYTKLDVSMQNKNTVYFFRGGQSI